MSENKKELAKRETDIVPSFAVSTEQALERMKALQDFVNRVMVKDTDYGTIPGTPKPTLLKPGAEKLCDIYGFAKQAEVTERIEDWHDGVFHYEVKVTLVNKRTGQVEAEGLGSANSKEKRYQKTVEKTKDPFSLVNTILKMAKKRSLVDAVLSATRTSGLFTQDVEDIGIAPEETPEEERRDPRLISKKQINYIHVLLEQKGIPDEDYKKMLGRDYGCESTTELSKDQAKDLIDVLLKQPDAEKTGAE